MEEIRPISHEDIHDVVRITALAYPGSNLLAPDNRQRFAERVQDTLENDQNASFHGLFREERMLGVMKWYDFFMNVRGIQMLTGGIGTVAVDLLHKKEKVAKAMLQGFLATYRERGVCLVSLYPFRVDFYKKMGFGVELGMDISDFSSLVMGVISLRKLHLYGLADISDEKQIPFVDRLFATGDKPRSTTPF
ncbi:GNAT family N-acetyltransferase [Brevibacillus centrosporus]|uniref:Acetyltransferase (GNAT) domain-containing protein n=1 Tax=Brevibacillus centrosporus TaxID=54910 RepID=A0A1I4D295_9BACL|nr:GNAT family N-acetyltransferase [Brevibacillus centrosporus]SFK87622.1 Acetyltransferase (GNAT) domain-containing protein [Brevibacillus centrosporus]